MEEMNEPGKEEEQTTSEESSISADASEASETSEESKEETSSAPQENAGTKVYVGNLPFSTGYEELKELFGSYGEIAEATVISDKFSGRSKGFGFVTFANKADAEKAISEMNEKDVGGRNIKVSEAKPFERSERPRRDFGDRPRRNNFGGGNRRY